MSEPDLEELKTFAEALARQAIQGVLGLKAGARTEIKPDGSPVTTVDRAVELTLRGSIERHYPDHGILGEEFGAKNSDTEWVWVLDPIDGTRHFVSGLSTYSVLIALCRRKRPVIGVVALPALGSIYLGISGGGAWLNGEPIKAAPVAELGQAFVSISELGAYKEEYRRGMEALAAASRWNLYDSGAGAYGVLAAGRLHLCLNAPNMEAWDICALVPLVEGAGGCISDWQGRPLTQDSSGAVLATAGPALHRQALALLGKA